MASAVIIRAIFVGTNLHEDATWNLQPKKEYTDNRITTGEIHAMCHKLLKSLKGGIDELPRALIQLGPEDFGNPTSHRVAVSSSTGYGGKRYFEVLVQLELSTSRPLLMPGAVRVDKAIFCDAAGVQGPAKHQLELISAQLHGRDMDQDLWLPSYTKEFSIRSERDAGGFRFIG